MRPRKLYTRIYISVVLMLLCAGGASFALFSLMFRSHTWRAPAERIAKRAAYHLAERFKDRTLVEHAVRVAEDLDIDLTLRDLDGKRMAIVGHELPPLSKADALAAKKGATFVTHRYFRWYVAVPVQNRGGETVGVLQVSLFRRLPIPNLLRPLFMLAAVLLLLAMLTWPLSRRISRPVEKMTEANRRFGGGDLSYRIPLTPRRAKHPHCPHGKEPLPVEDELMELMRSWNEMAERTQGLVQNQKELLANVSHELRSPLSRIRLALALLQDDGDAAALSRRMASIEGDLTELERLIEDVLTASRLEVRGLPVHLAQVSVAGLLRSVAERFDGAAEVGPCEENLVLELDEALLRRALGNLVENAQKYGAPPITLSAERVGVGPEATVVLSVSDQGPGIASEERQRVLEPFYRMDRARTPDATGTPGGFGLGLTLVRRITEVHGGRVEVAAASTKAGSEWGCKVSLVFPVPRVLDP